MSTFRVSDEDRERVAESLRGDLLAGRLTVEEYEERLARAYRAATRADLDAMAADLPRVRPSAPRRCGRLLRTSFARATRSSGRRRASSSFTRNRRPAWTIFVAIFVFPFGLLALTHKARESQVFVNAIAAGEGRTLVDVVGVAPAGVRRAIAELET